MKKPIIEIHRVSKKYQLGQREPYGFLRDQLAGIFSGKKKAQNKNDFWALKDVSFNVHQGETVGIIGRNGAGKSTILKILSQITPPTEGSITMRGKVSSLLEVGTGFHSELTGRENIYLNGAILGMGRQEIKRNFDSIVDFSEIGQFIDTPVKRYSSGMYVRLAFAVAAHLDPEVLIVDEVLSVGDAQFQKKCLGKMASIGKEGRTVVFVSHNMPSIQSLCQTGIWLDKGKVVEIGKIDQVVTNYIAATVNNPDWSADHYTDGPLIIKHIVFKNAQGRKTTDFTPGEDLSIEIHYRAKEKIEKPSFWLAVNASYGSMFMASMLYDDFRPKYLEGEGVIKCRFYQMPLLPGLYSIQMGVSSKNIFETVAPSREIGLFNVTGKMKDAGFPGENANQILGDSTKLVIPYQWTLTDGATKQFAIRPRQKQMKYPKK